MTIIVILALTFLQFICGIGLLAIFLPVLRGVAILPLALLLGIAVFSLVPFLLQLLCIPLTITTVFAGLGIVTVLLNLYYKRSLQLARSIIRRRPVVHLYEWPFLALIGLIVFVSVWRCYYYPPLPRDLTSGAEVIAEYAVREHTMINSVFTVDLTSTNNPFKPPFITSLQIIYKYAGLPFGQIWLCTVFISFIMLLYKVMATLLHRLLVGALLLCFLAIPEMYAYTFMVLFDYSNAVYFFLSVYFLNGYLQQRAPFRNLFFAAFLMGIATYIRSETLILACFFVPLLAFIQWKRHRNVWSIVAACSSFVLPAVLFYLVSITLYINRYLPLSYNIGYLVNQHLSDLQPFFKRFFAMNAKLFIGSYAYTLYGCFIWLFFFLFVLEIVVYRRRLSFSAGLWLYAVGVIYLGYPFLGYLLPLLDLENSTKRGMFKIFPLMLLYMCNNRLLIRWSARLRWKGSPEIKEGAPDGLV